MGRKLRGALLSATWLSCLIIGSAPATAGTVAPISGDLSPLYGKINPFYGDVNSTYGKINPFYGKINPFYGKINPFWGDVTSYWGKINPFTQDTSAITIASYGTKYDPFWGAGQLNPYTSVSPVGSYKSLGAFWQTELTSWNAVQAKWSTVVTLNDAQNLANQIQNTIFNPAISVFGAAIQKGTGAPGGTKDLTGTWLAAGVAGGADSGKSGRKAAQLNAAIQRMFEPTGMKFVNGVIDPASLLAMDPSQRAMMFLNMYDFMMDYSGTGHVDWWMGQVGWSPALATAVGTTPGGSTKPTVGMIDAAITLDKHVSKQVLQFGSQAFNDGHGAAVASLIMGSVDGSGILGIMPQDSVNVAVYDPYDATGTTNWTDVGTGIKALSTSIFGGKTVPVGVLNASLGEPGFTLSPGWNDALKAAGAYGHNLVIAAGNDGKTQTTNVPWSFSTNPNLIIVGSVGVDGTISNFSNRPGEACLLPTGTSFCMESNKLKYRFIVAPGELILVSDGLGGHFRQSGTSLAAPLVSGAIALLQNRWPWLSKYPEETAQIILKSATKKGLIPGADPVYGVGELNVAASQAPLNWNTLLYYQSYNGKPGLIPLSLGTVVLQVRTSTQSSWDASGLYYSAIEQIGATHRDFQIPLSSKLVGVDVTSEGGKQDYQSNLTGMLRAQAGYFAGLASELPGSGALTNGFARSTVPAGQVGGMQLRVRVAPAEVGNTFRLGGSRYFTDAMLVTDGASVQFGYGNGASALDASRAFAFSSDYAPGTGGANPLLGLASGGSYAGARVQAVAGLTIGFGTSDRSSRRDLTRLGLDRGFGGAWIDRYDAHARNINLSYQLSDALVARAGLTRLREDTGLLGIQSLDRADLAGGSTTTGASFGADLAIGRGWSLSGTSTVARTRSGAGQIRSEGLTSASAAMAVIKSHLLARTDELRLTLASPLHTVGGRIRYDSVGIVDRDTGALGVITQSFRPRSSLPLAASASYGMALPKGKGEFSLFGRFERTSELTAVQNTGYAGGAQLRLAFR